MTYNNEYLDWLKTDYIPMGGGQDEKNESGDTNEPQNTENSDKTDDTEQTEQQIESKKTDTDESDEEKEFDADKFLMGSLTPEEYKELRSAKDERDQLKEKLAKYESSKEDKSSTKEDSSLIDTLATKYWGESSENAKPFLKDLINGLREMGIGKSSDIEKMVRESVKNEFSDRELKSKDT